MSGTSTVPAGSATGARPWARVGMAALIILVTALGALLGAVPGDLVPYVAAGVVSILLTLFCIGRPAWLLYFILFTSAFAGFFGVFESGRVGGVSVSGLRWVVVASLALLVLAVNLRRVYVSRTMVPFLVFAAWSLVGFLHHPLGFTGLKDVVFFALPPLASIYTLLVLRYDQPGVSRVVERVITASLTVPIVLYAILFALGQVSFTRLGPEGLIGPRVVALYLLVVIGVSLAQWRYGETEMQRLIGLGVSVVATLTIFLTLSRTASVTALAVIVGSRMHPKYPLRVIASGLVVLVLTGLLLWLVPQFRERTFYKVGPDLVSTLRYFNTSGRIVLWPATYEHAMKQPLVGWGPGAARILLGPLSSNPNDEDQKYPHNEYLLVVHDLGLIGLAVFLAAWGFLVRRYWRGWRLADAAGDRRRARWSLAALLAAVVVLLSAIAANTLHYSFLMVPAFIIFGIRDYWVEHGGEGPSNPSPVPAS